MEQLKDPDHLSTIALTLHQVSPATRRNSTIYDQKDAAAILDALARLLICKPSDQTVALGAVQGPDSHVELHIAGNPDPDPKTVAHLKDVCARLVNIRATINASPVRGS